MIKAISQLIYHIILLKVTHTIKNDVSAETFFSPVYFSAWQTVALFISVHPVCKGATKQKKGGQMMMIMFQGQIEAVGSHQALISKAADSVQRCCRRISFHRRQGCVLRPGYKQTDTASEGHAKCTLHSVPGRGPRQTLWNYSFPPTCSDCTTQTSAGLPLLTAQTVWLSQVHILP